MDKDEVLSIYDDWYADSYDERFHGGDVWNDNLGAYKVELVEELLPDGGRWLDTGCGTGKHLAALPGVDRCGLDLSPSMLRKARAANPGVPFIEGSYLDDHPEWAGHWDLVSNLWLSYQFVDSIKQLEAVVANLASWVSPDGSLLMHVADCEDVARGVQLPWEDPDTPVFADSLYITAVLWTWKESNGRVHRDLVAPQLQRMVNIVARHFDAVEVRRWPSTFPGSDRPKAVIGRGRRAVPLTAAEVGDTYPYELTYPPADHPREHGFGEPVDDPVATDLPVEEGTPVEELAALEELAAVDELAAVTAADVEPPGPAEEPPAPVTSGPAVGALPTGDLLREVVRRSSPGDLRVWRAIARQAGVRARGLARRR